jgi:Arc/MetJ-type ribon-helix-helix transcriptional regulator
MGTRLVLSTVGIKSPLDVGDDAGDPPVDAARAEADPPPAPAPRRSSPRRRRPAPSKTPRRADSSGPSSEMPFYGSGRPLQTSIALDAERASLLDELARAAGVSVNALAVAALHAGLPAAPDDARAEIVDERVGRAGMRAARIERNLRLPEHLRARIDELTSAARGRLPRATRADLINAALRRGLPGDAEHAAQLVADHARRIERAAAA